MKKTKEQKKLKTDASISDADGLATVTIKHNVDKPARKISRKGHQTDDFQKGNARPADGESQYRHVKHAGHALSDQFDDGSHVADTKHGVYAEVINGSGQDGNEPHSAQAAPYPIISALWRQRYAWVKSRTAMTLSAQARCRAFANGDKIEASKIWKNYCKGGETDRHLAITLRPYQNAIAMFDAEIKPVEKQLLKLVKALPCYPWMIAHKGIGGLYIAGIYGECNGPITKSHSISALWKFFGLAVYDGKRQAFQTDIAENKKQSYSSRRRSLIAQIETAFVMTSSPGWRELYEERKEYELAKGCQKGHAHNRAKRYVGKRFLRELYKHARIVESSHIMDENHVCDAVQDEVAGNHYVSANHALDVPRHSLLELA